MQKKFVIVTPTSGSNNGSFDVVCAENRDRDRSTTIIVDGRDIVKTVNVNQNMTDKVYPLVYYMFPFTVLENYAVGQEGSFYNIIADAHITNAVEIADVAIGLYNLKALKPNIDLAGGHILKQVDINLGGNAPVEFYFNSAGIPSSKFNGMAISPIPPNKQDEFKTLIQRIINIKTGYIKFHMTFNNASIWYQINIMSD